jgi:hypothetical protein
LLNKKMLIFKIHNIFYFKFYLILNDADNYPNLIYYYVILLSNNNIYNFNKNLKT